MKNMDMSILKNIEIRSLVVGGFLVIVGAAGAMGTNGKFFSWFDVSKRQTYLGNFSWLQVSGTFVGLSGIFMVANSVGILSRAKAIVEDIPIGGQFVELVETQTTI